MLCNRTLRLLLSASALLGLGTLPLQAQQTLYVANPNANNILAFAPGSATPTIFAGNLNDPQGIAVDALGNVYSTNGQSIIKFSANGASLGTFATAGLDLPNLLTFDAQGNLYAANEGSVTEYDSTGALVKKLNTFSNTNGVLVLGDGTVLASQGEADNSGNFTIQEFAPGAIISTPLIQISSFTNGAPDGMAVGADGNLYVAEHSFSNGLVEEFSSSGADLGTFASGIPEAAGLAFDAQGNLFVSDSYDNQIEEFAPNKSLIQTFQTGSGSGLFSPDGLAFGPAAAPEPSGLTALAAGLLGLGALAFRARKRTQGV